jgi:hypothetical protein
MEAWTIGITANGVIALAYFAIALHIFLGLKMPLPWRTNPLALATGAIFLSCGIGHALHALHAVDPFDRQVSAASRVVLGDFHMWFFDSITAGVGIWYWTLRGRFPALVRGSALFEDMRVRQRQALDIHDNVVQGLVKAKMSMEVGELERGRAELETTLQASRKIMSELLGEAGATRPIKPGELVRRTDPEAPR